MNIALYKSSLSIVKKNELKKKNKQTYLLASNFKDVCNFDSNRFMRFMVLRNYDISREMRNL